MPRNDKKTMPYEVLPHAGTPVWRYLSLAKLLALLTNRSVYFCRADRFDDVFEGSFTEGSLRDHAIEWGTGAQYLDRLATMARWIPCRSYVSCWHASEVESAALWRIYAGSEGAVALKSTIGTLQLTFPNMSESKDDMIISQDVRRVQYIDYRSAHPDINDLAGPLCYKRKAYSFEQEIRVIRQELPTRPSPRAGQPNGRAIDMGPPPEDIGRNIPVNIEQLVKAVHIAPSSPAWLLPAIRQTMMSCGFSAIECRQSSLDELPEFGRFGAQLTPLSSTASPNRGD